MRMNTSYAGAQAIVLPITGRTEKMGSAAGRETARVFFNLPEVDRNGSRGGPRFRYQGLFPGNDRKNMIPS